jgi:flagellar hook-basal body complex protein FliE
MHDPIGLVGQSGVQGIGPLQPGKTPAGGRATDPDAPNFMDLLKQNMDEVNRLQQDASQAVEDLVANRRTDVESVITATQKADMAFQMLMQVRNKVLDAYEELKQMRV